LTQSEPQANRRRPEPAAHSPHRPGGTPVPALLGLAVHGLQFAYPGREVFLDWSHHFGPGLHWVHGANGCGKTSLLQLLAGALPVGQGELVAAGVSLNAAPLGYRRQVFWCGPGAMAFDHLSPLEYAGFMRGLYPGFDVTAWHRHVEGFGLAPFLQQRLRQLSTGTQRKAWLACGLSAGTPVLLLDEPGNALDETSLAHLRDALTAINEQAPQLQRCCIVASHGDLGLQVPLSHQLALAPPGASPQA
jgi:ABC-type multidrug transport system ATPase subunit